MLRLDTSTAGLVLATMPIVMGVVAPMAGWLADRFGTQVIAMVGLLILGVGFFLVQSLDVNTTVVECGLRFAIIGLGLALFQSPNNSAILGAAPREKAGVASGLLAVARTLGQTAGIAVTGAFWVARVAQHAGGLPEGGASRASAAAQLSGLHDTYWVILVLTGLSFAIIGRVVLGGRRQVLAVDEPAKSQ
jgi:MFS family permease